MKTSKKHIVILGGGFAGIYSALSILKSCGDEVEITIINKANYFLFTPMLHEVATGGLGHHQVVESIREIIRKTPIRFFEATILSVDTFEKHVLTDQGTKPYDILVVALGASTNFFGTEGAEEHSFVLKDLMDAIRIRNHVIDQFEQASHAHDLEIEKQLLSFVVVGGGATGVEYASELAEFAKKTLGRYYQTEFAESDPVTVTLVHSGPELLAPFSPQSRHRAYESLVRKGVDVVLNGKVVSVTTDSVLLGSGEKIKTNTVVWTAGVKPNAVVVSGKELPKDKTGRIITDTSFLVEGFTDIFALGDIAAVPASDGKPYPMLAQIAVAEARQLGKNIKAVLSGIQPTAFVYSQKGSLVSLGKWEAAGTISGIHLYGKFAWFVWRTVYLFKFISNSKRLKIAMDWTVGLFFPRDITRA